MKQSIFIKSAVYFLAVMVVSLLAGYLVFADWTGPATSPPSSNPLPPLTVDSTPQVKAGRMSAAAFLDYNDPDYYLKNESGNTRLSGNLSFGSLLIDYVNVYNIYNPAAQYLNTFDPAIPNTPQTFTGVISLDALPY